MANLTLSEKRKQRNTGNQAAGESSGGLSLSLAQKRALNNAGTLREEPEPYKATAEDLMQRNYWLQSTSGIRAGMRDRALTPSLKDSDVLFPEVVPVSRRRVGTGEAGEAARTISPDRVGPVDAREIVEMPSKEETDALLEDALGFLEKHANDGKPTENPLTAGRPNLFVSQAEPKPVPQSMRVGADEIATTDEQSEAERQARMRELYDSVYSPEDRARIDEQNAQIDKEMEDWWAEVDKTYEGIRQRNPDVIYSGLDLQELQQSPDYRAKAEAGKANKGNKVEQALQMYNMAMQTPYFRKNGDNDYFTAQDLNSMGRDILPLQAASEARDKGYIHMTQGMRDMYAYLLEAYGPKVADRYLAQLGDDLQTIEAQKRVEDMYKETGNAFRDSDIGKFLRTANTALESGANQPVTGWTRFINQMTGNTYHQPGDISQNVSQLVKENLSADENGIKIFGKPIGRVAYDLLETTASQWPQILTGGILGGNQVQTLIPMVLQVAGNDYDDMISQGYDQESARWHAFLTALTEYGTEIIGGVGFISGGTLTEDATEEIIRLMKPGVLKLAASLGINMAGEGVEEFISGTIGPLIDAVTKGEKPEWNWQDIGYEAALGGLSGLTMGAPVEVGQFISEQSGVRAVNNTAQGLATAENMASVLREGMLAYGMDEATADKYAPLAEKLINGETMTPEELMDLASNTPVAEFVNDVTERYYKEHPNETEAPEEISIDTYRARGEAASQKAIRDTARAYEGAADQADVIKKGMVAYGIEDGTAEKLAGIASRLINGENVSEEDVRMLANYTPAAEFLDEVMKTIENPQWHNVGTGEEIRREAKPELPQEPTEQTYEAPEAAPRAEQQKPELPAEQTYEAPKAEQQKPEIQTEQTYEAPESETEAETTVQTEPGKNVGEGQRTRQRPRMLTADELRARLEESRSARMSPEEFKAYVEKAKGTYTNKGMREQLAEMKTRRGEREATRRDRDSIITVNNTEVSVDSIDVGENGTVTLHLGTGETAKLGDKGVNIGTGETAKAIAIASKLGVDGKRFFEIYRKGQTAQKVSDFLAEYDQAYTFGKNNVPITENIRNGFGTLTPEQIEDAYADGKAQAAKPEAETPANKIGDPANAKEGTVDTTGIRGVSLTAQQKASVEASKTIAQALGIDVVWYASETDENGKRVGANGKYDTQTGKIYLDIYAGSNFRQDLQTSALSTMSHELTHFIEQWNPTEYAKLRGMVFDYLGKQNVDIADLIERKRARSAHGTISTDVAIQEIVADGMEMMLADSKAITEYSQQDKTLWQKIKSKITEFIGNIRKAFEGVKIAHTEARALMQDVNGVMRYMDGLQETWDRALVGASQAYRNSPARQRTTEAQAEPAPQLTSTEQKAAKDGAPMTMPYEEVSRIRSAEKGKAGVTYATKKITQAGDLPLQLRRQAQILNEIGKTYGIEFVLHDEISGGALDGVYITGNAIHVAVNSTSNGIIAAGVHETVHYIRGLSEQSFTELSDGVSNILGQADYETAWKARMKNEGLDVETAKEEVIAEALPAIFGNERVMERFVERHPDLSKKFAGKLREFVNHVRGILERLGGAKRHPEIARMLKAADDQAQALLDNYEKALAEAQRRAEEIGYTGYIDPAHTETGVNVKESKSTLGAWKANLRAEARQIGTKEAIARAESAIESVMDFVNRAKDSALAWQFLQSGTVNPYAGNMGPLRTNVEYVYSFDPDTNCWRQSDYARIKKDIETRLGRKMTVVETQNLTTLMQEFGAMIPCRYCYLYTKRALLDEAYTNKIKEWYVKPRLGSEYSDATGDKLKKAVSKWLQKNGTEMTDKLIDNVYHEVEAARRVMFNWLDDTFKVNERYTFDKENAVRIFQMPQTTVNGKTRNLKVEEIVRMLSDHFGLTLDKSVDKNGKEKSGLMVTFLSNIVGEWINDLYILKDHNVDQLAVPNGMKGDLPDGWKPNNDLMQIHAAAFLAAENGINANLPKDYAPYDHQIWNIKDRDMLNMIAHDGVRLQSSTDTRVEDILDYMQLLADMAAYEKDLWDDAKQKWVHVKGLNGHMYAKSEIGAKILAPSGLHINCSIAFDGDTIGKIKPSWQESMNADEAIALSKKYKNVGVMAMVTNPAQLAHALEMYRADKNGNRQVHMIIPFHASGLSERYWKDVMGWQDYTKTQNETFRTEQQMREALDKAGVKIPSNYKEKGVASLYYKKLGNPDTALYVKGKGSNVKRVTPHFLPEDSILMGCDADGNAKAYTIPGHHNDYQTYIDLCKKYDVNPRFYNIEVPNINGEGTRKIIDDPDTYMAVIHESRADAPKGPVKADFDVDYAIEQLKAAAQKDQKIREKYTETRDMPEAERLAIRQANRITQYDSFGIGKVFHDEGLEGEERLAITKDVADVRKAAGIPVDEKKILVLRNEEMLENARYLKGAQERAKMSGVDRFSERDYNDEAYMEAVRKNDTAAQRRLVDEAAKKAGYTIKAHHGSDADRFTVFSPGERGEMWFSSTPETAYQRKEIYNTFLRIRKPYEETDYVGVISKFDPTEVTENGRSNGHDGAIVHFRIDPDLANKNIETLKAAKIDKPATDEFGDIFSFLPSTEERANLAKPGESLADFMKRGSEEDLYRWYVVYRPEQIKSAELIERDDNGNVIPLSERFNPERNDIRFSEREEEAEKHFGTTDDYNVAGYITSNGSMLDFSGKHWGARNSRQRTVEHYDISEIYGDDIDRADAQRDFIANGAIRVSPENGGIEISKEPTKRQYDALRGFIGSHNGEVTLDIVDGNERAIESMDWPRGTSAGVILGDIRKYFENGTVPATRSITADFRYQPREDDQISDRELLANALASTARTVEEKNNIVNYKRRIAYLNVMQDHADGLLRRINSGKLTPEQYRAAEEDYARTMNGIALQDKALLKLEAAKPLQQVLVRERQKATEQAKARADKRIESVREAQKTQYERKTERMLAKVEQYREAYAAEKEKARLDRIEMRQKVAAAKQAGAAAAKQAVAAERERAERVEEHQARIEKIRKAVKRLNQTLTAPDNTHFVPDEMRDAVKDMMEVFLNDTSVFDRSRLNNLKTAYEHMFTSDADRGSTLYDPDIEEKIDTLGQTILNRRLSQLGNYELQMVQDIVDHMNFLLSEADKVFVEGRKQDAAELAAKIKIEAADAGEKTTVPWMRRTIEFLREGNVTPIYFFRRMGGTMEKLFKGFLEGETKWAKQMQKTREYFEATTKKYHYWDWADVKGDTLKFETSFGDNIELTRQQAMALWATRVREYNNPMQNAKHLEDGGFVYDKPQKATKKKLGIFTAETENQKAHRLNDDDIKVIADWLTDEQRDFVMEMCRYLSQDMSELGNETSKQLHGYSKFLEKFYYPYKSSKTFMASEPGKAEAAMLKNVGFSKALTQSAKNPIIATDFVKTWADHCTQMIMYNAMAKAQDDFMRVYNHKVSSTAKTGYESVKESLINAYGQEATRYIETLMQDMYGGINRGYGDSLGKWVNKFKKGATFASLSVAIQQPSAIMRAMAMVDPRYFVQTMRFSRNKAASEMMKYAGTAIIKRMGRFDMNSGKSSAEWLAANNTDDMEFRQKLKQFVNRKDSSYRDDILSKMPEKMDEITWAHIWLACKAETAAKTGLTGEALLQATGQRFDEIARRTQVYDSVLVRSQVMRDQGMFPKMFTAFMAEPTLTYNMMLDAAMNAKKGPEGRRFAAKAGAALVGQIVLNTLLKSIITAMRDKDDDKTYLEKYAAHVVSSLLGTPLNDKMGPVSAVVGALSSEFSPMTMIPLAQDVLNIFNGYDVERSDMSLVNDLYDATKDLYNDKKTGYEKTRSFAGAVAAFFGLPVKNVWRDIDGAINTATSKAINTTTGQGIKYAIMEEMGYNNAYTTNVTRLYLAALRGDDQEMKRLRDHIKADLKNSKGENYTDKDINSKLTSMIKEDYLDGNETRSDTVKMLQKIAGVNGDDEAKALVYSWEKAEIKEDYQEGSMSAAEAQKALIDRAGVEKDEAPKMVRQWEVTAETDSSSPYARVWGYISKWDGSKLKAEIKELKNLGYTDTGITSSITAHFKDEYVAASKSQRATLKAHLIEAYKLVGYTQDKAAAKIDKWLED